MLAWERCSARRVPRYFFAAARALSRLCLLLNKNFTAIPSQIIFAKLSTWRAAAAAGSIAPPKLVSSDWRVDVKASTQGVKRTGEPTVLLNMKLQQNADSVGQMPASETVTAELSQAALSTLLAGLHQVRDQLAAAAQ